MKLSAKQLNRFLILKLPSAYLCGVRAVTLTNKQCTARVKFKWINKNPFKSIYFAVLSMTAELSTGALVLKNVHNTNQLYSTLVVGMNALFYKKAVGKIVFKCNAGEDIEKSIKKAQETKEGVVFKLCTIGIDEAGDEVAKFEFDWSIKIKQ